MLTVRAYNIFFGCNDLKEYLLKTTILLHNQRHSVVAADESKFCEVMCAMFSLLLDITIRCSIDDEKSEGDKLLDNGQLLLGRSYERFVECLAQIVLPENNHNTRVYRVHSNPK